MPIRLRLPWTAVLTGLVVVGLVPGCGGPPPDGPPHRPPPEVVVQVVEPKPVRLTDELPGRVSACLVAEVRPQVGGIIQDRLFTEGADVKAGDVLYQIDPSVYQANYDQAAASLTRAEAGLESARAVLMQARASRTTAEAGLEAARTVLVSARAALTGAEASTLPLRLSVERLRSLLANRTVSQQEYDNAVGAAEHSSAEVDRAQAGIRGAEAEIARAQAAVQVVAAQIESAGAAVQVAQAGIDSAKAMLESARIRLAFTQVTAPIAGRIGRSAVTIGALVVAFRPMALAIIQQLDPVYVDTSQSTSRLLRLKRRIASGELRAAGPSRLNVGLVLEDGSAYPLQGSLRFSDVSVDPSTGSIALRSVFSNPDEVLLPGMFVRAVIEAGVMEKAILIPQQAVQYDPKGRPFVLTVGEGDKAEMRMLTLERALGDKWLVASGLAARERVIVEGLQHVRPGMPVVVVPAGATGAGHGPPELTSSSGPRPN